MYKIGIIGDRESILGFMALGFSVFETDTAAEAEKLLDQLAEEDFAVLYITQTYAALLEEKISSYFSKPLPAIVPIPDVNGGGYGEKILKKAVERAVGADILFKE